MFYLVLLKSSLIINHFIDALFVEKRVLNVIQSALSVKRTTMTSNDLNQIQATLLPGEVYPDDQVHVIDIYDDVEDLYISREACCGTHVQNTSDIIDFCIVQYKYYSNKCTLVALTGLLCSDAKIRGKSLVEKSKVIENLVNSTNLHNITTETVKI